MANMQFQVKVVKDELLNKGSVFTVRSYMLFGASVVNVPDVGKCTRRMVGKVVSKEFLQEFVHNSGFAAVDAWWSYVLKFKAQNGFLYEVTRL